MEVILKEDVPGLGHKYDLVLVKNGYARNFLIPKNLAAIANASNKRTLKEETKQRAKKEKEQLERMKKLKGEIEALELKMPAEAGETGKIFGSITALQVSDALRLAGFDIDKNKISFPEPVRELGEHKAHISLHKEVLAVIDFVAHAKPK